VIAEAIDTALTLAWALAGWVIFLATVAAILALAAIACGAWGVRALWRRATGPSWARGRIRARIHAARRLRRSNGRTRPLWSHSQPLDYEEAA
jgi:hypothetical protein